MKRNLTIIIVGMGALWVLSTGVFLFYAADLVTIPWLLIAFGAMDAAFGLALALLITTNTRPRWPDVYGVDTADLLRPPLHIDDERRVRPGTVDDRGVVQRLSDILEDEAAKRQPGETPAWVVDMNRVHHQRTDETFKEGDE